MNKDLFPETLLVYVVDGHTFTTSLKVAEHFQKRHDDVLKAIKKLINDYHSLRNFAESDCPDKEFAELNFQPSLYQNERGKTYPMYKITEKGFALLAMGFSGKQALQWKIDFLTAFENMETALKAKTKREANALSILRPHLLVVAQGTEDGESRAAIAAKTGHRSLSTITANRRRCHQLGLLH